MILLTTTLALGIISIFISKVFTRYTFTPCLLYWIAWFFAIACAEIAALVGLLPEIGAVGRKLIIHAHIGAFIGFSYASLMYEFMGLRFVNRKSYLPFSESLTKNVEKVFLPLYLTVGLLHLIYQVTQIGLISLALFLEMRLHFLFNPYGPITKIAEYLFTSVGVVLMLFAWEDSYKGIRFKRFLIVFIASAIHGTAMGGRSWIFAVPLGYSLAYLFSGSEKDLFIRLKPLFKRVIVPLFIVGLSIFSVLGMLREAHIEEKLERDKPISWYQRPYGPMQFVIYGGVPVAAIEAMSLNAEKHPRTYGQLLFTWPAKQLGRIGPIDYVHQAQVMDRESIFLEDERIAWTQGTIIPPIVGDFGLSSVLIVMSIIMAICQFAALALRCKGIFLHFIAMVAITTAFFSIQDPYFGFATVYWGIGWLIVFLWLFKKRVTVRIAASQVRTIPHGSGLS